MSLTPENIDLVRAGWARVAPVKQHAGRAFYATLFNMAPAVRPMFKEDISGQAEKLMNTLDFIVDALDELETLVPAAQELAVRHVGYGAVDAHYDAVGQALVITLKDMLGPQFDEEQERAWTEVYGALSDVMIDAAKSAS